MGALDSIWGTISDLADDAAANPLNTGGGGGGTTVTYDPISGAALPPGWKAVITGDEVVYIDEFDEKVNTVKMPSSGAAGGGSGPGPVIVPPNPAQAADLLFAKYDRLLEQEQLTADQAIEQFKADFTVAQENWSNYNQQQNRLLDEQQLQLERDKEVASQTTSRQRSLLDALPSASPTPMMNIPLFEGVFGEGSMVPTHAVNTNDYLNAGMQGLLTPPPSVQQGPLLQQPETLTAPTFPSMNMPAMPDITPFINMLMSPQYY